MQMHFHRKLPIPQEVKKEFSLTERMIKVKEERDEEIRKVFDGTSDKFILIIGPCSADHSEPVLEYISRLKRVEEQVSDKILMIPRIYTNKPRTTGKGYKGMQNLICIKGLLQFVSYIEQHLEIMILLVQMKCFIQRIIDIFLTCFLMLQLGHVLWKISSTD